MISRSKKYIELRRWLTVLLVAALTLAVLPGLKTEAAAAQVPLAGIVQISNNHALDKNAVLWGWDDGEYAAKPLLEQVESFWSDGFVGGAVKKDGSVWLWGTKANTAMIDTDGPLSQHAFYQTEPVQIAGLPKCLMVVGRYAVDLSGIVWYIDPEKRIASKVPGLIDIKTVNDNYALDHSGNLWTWNFNTKGILYEEPAVVALNIAYLGDGLALSDKWGVYDLWKNDYLVRHGGGAYSPDIDLSPISRNINSIAGSADDRGSDYSLIVKQDGSIWSWGFGISYAFQQVKGLSGIKAAAAKYKGGTVLYKDGTVGAWIGVPEGGFPPQEKPSGLKVKPVKVTKQIIVMLNGKTIAIQPSPLFSGGRVLIPVRGFFEALGGTVNYDKDKVTIKYGNQKVELVVWSTEAIIDGKQTKLDVPAQIIKGRTMVPLRFVAEAIGGTVKWDSARSRVELTIAE
ncbi:stalk domain-containing protein [Paenibacillus harenae]|uniref:stalk domain-containing protein n=1 Tax=Paenibacillus harenae TaxID=306543 RepID=UPI00279083E8|nr:stalk domain-containing protein [Paenibacillus harenae]MDQ0060951.1 hypothetical protein [Paenibacillus harenae]